MTLKVRNDGQPIPEEFLPHIFEPFVRGADSGRRRGSVGLGLYIVREVAEAHGGQVKVTSTQAGGTAFTVSLPLRSE